MFFHGTNLDPKDPLPNGLPTILHAPTTLTISGQKFKVEKSVVKQSLKILKNDISIRQSKRIALTPSPPSQEGKQ